MKKKNQVYLIVFAIVFISSCQKNHPFHVGPPVVYQDSSIYLIVKDSTGLTFYPTFGPRTFKLSILHTKKDTLYAEMDWMLYYSFEKEHIKQNAPKPKRLKYTYIRKQDSIEFVSQPTGNKKIIWPIDRQLLWDSIQIKMRSSNKSILKDQFSFNRGESMEIDIMVQQLFYRDGIKHLPIGHPKDIKLLLFRGKDTLNQVDTQIVPFYAGEVMFGPGGKARKVTHEVDEQ